MRSISSIYYFTQTYFWSVHYFKGSKKLFKRLINETDMKIWHDYTRSFDAINLKIFFGTFSLGQSQNFIWFIRKQVPLFLQSFSKHFSSTQGCFSIKSFFITNCRFDFDVSDFISPIQNILVKCFFIEFYQEWHYITVSESHIWCPQSSINQYKNLFD